MKRLIILNCIAAGMSLTRCMFSLSAELSQLASYQCFLHRSSFVFGVLQHHGSHMLQYSKHIASIGMTSLIHHREITMETISRDILDS